MKLEGNSDLLAEKKKKKKKKIPGLITVSIQTVDRSNNVPNLQTCSRFKKKKINNHRVIFGQCFHSLNFRILRSYMYCTNVYIYWVYLYMHPHITFVYLYNVHITS